MPASSFDSLATPQFAGDDLSATHRHGAAYSFDFLAQARETFAQRQPDFTYSRTGSRTVVPRNITAGQPRTITSLCLPTLSQRQTFQPNNRF